MKEDHDRHDMEQGGWAERPSDNCSINGMKVKLVVVQMSTSPTAASFSIHRSLVQDSLRYSDLWSTMCGIVFNLHTLSHVHQVIYIIYNNS